MFVTDALLRKSVVVCQALGRRGIEVTAGSATRLSPAFFSRYCRRQVIYPCPQKRPDDFVDMMLGYLQQNRHDVLFPTDDATLSLISRHRGDFEKVTHVPIPAPEQVSAGLDKARAMAVAERLGVPHPRTARPRDAAEARRAAAALGRGVVIKPRSSSGGRGIVYVGPDQDAGEAWQAVHEVHPLPLLQERLPGGPKYDVCVIVDHRGKVAASFVQKELRHFPVQDGMSTVQESVWRPDLVERATALLQAIGWYGLAELEFMEHPETGEAMFLEINPRFWASVRLAIACGVDFPYLLYQVARRQPIKAVRRYAVGRRCRWLLPGDVLHFLSNPNRLRLEPSFFRFGGQTVYDGIDPEDPGATVGVLVSCGHYLFDPDLWGLLLRGKKRRAAPSPPQAPAGPVAPPVWRRLAGADLRSVPLRRAAA